MSVNHIQDLPKDISLQVFNLLPYRSIQACFLVCKQWNEFIRNSENFQERLSNKRFNFLIERLIKNGGNRTIIEKNHSDYTAFSGDNLFITRNSCIFKLKISEIKNIQRIGVNYNSTSHALVDDKGFKVPQIEAHLIAGLQDAPNKASAVFCYKNYLLVGTTLGKIEAYGQEKLDYIGSITHSYYRAHSQRLERIALIGMVDNRLFAYLFTGPNALHFEFNIQDIISPWGFFLPNVTLSDRIPLTYCSLIEESGASSTLTYSWDSLATNAKGNRHLNHVQRGRDSLPVNSPVAFGTIENKPAYVVQFVTYHYDHNRYDGDPSFTYKSKFYFLNDPQTSTHFTEIREPIVLDQPLDFKTIESGEVNVYDRSFPPSLSHWFVIKYKQLAILSGRTTTTIYHHIDTTESGKSQATAMSGSTKYVHEENEEDTAFDLLMNHFSTEHGEKEPDLKRHKS